MLPCYCCLGASLPEGNFQSSYFQVLKVSCDNTLCPSMGVGCLYDLPITNKELMRNCIQALVLELNPFAENCFVCWSLLSPR